MLNKPAIWTLSIVACATGLGAIIVASQDHPTPPTELSRRPEATTPLAFPVDPRTLLDPREPGDAGATYRALADADASPYDRVIRDHDRSANFDALLAATRQQSSPIFTPAEIVHYGDDDRVQRLAIVGRAAVIAGMLKHDPALFDAAFSLGMRLAEERRTWREFQAGVELMSGSAAAMVDAHEPRAAVAQRFLDAQRDAMRDRWTPLFAAIDTRQEPLIAKHSGDLFAIASNATVDRMYRVEAILKLGRMRFNVGTPPRAVDQRHAGELLDELASRETDPVLRRAIDLARGLTVEQFRTLR